MHQRKLIWRKLKSEGILDSDNPRLQAFVTFLRDNPELCWKEVVPVFRKDFYDCFDAVAPVLAEIKDPMIQGALVKLADPKKSKERKLLEKMAKKTEPARDQMTVKLLALTKNKKITNILKLKTLPENLKVEIKEAQTSLELP